MKRFRRLLFASFLSILWVVFVTPHQSVAQGSLPSLAPITIDNAGQVAQVASLEGHAGTVNSVAFSPIDALLASGGEDGTVRIWDLTNAEQSMLFEEHTGSVNAVSFSPDGTQVASAGFDLRLLLWDIETGRSSLHSGLNSDSVDLFHSLFEPPPALHSISWLSTTTPFAVGDFSIVMPSTSGQIQIQTSDPHFLSIAIWLAGDTDNPDPDNSKAAVGTSSGLQVNGEPTLGYSAVVRSVAFSPDGTLLVTGDEANSVILWDTTNPEDVVEIVSLEGHQGNVTSVAFSPDGTLLVSASLDGTLRLWDVDSQVEVATISTENQAELFSVAFSPDGTLIASGSSDGVVRLWGVSESSEETENIASDTGSITGVVSLPGGDPAVGATVMLVRFEDRSLEDLQSTPLSRLSASEVDFMADNWGVTQAEYLNSVVALFAALDAPQDSSKVLQSTQTDADGQFILEDIPPHEYIIVATTTISGFGQCGGAVLTPLKIMNSEQVTQDIAFGTESDLQRLADLNAVGLIGEVVTTCNP